MVLPALPALPSIGAGTAAAAGTVGGSLFSNVGGDGAWYTGPDPLGLGPDQQSGNEPQDTGSSGSPDPVQEATGGLVTLPLAVGGAILALVAFAVVSD